MAKRVYREKVVSPELARENALSSAKAHVHNETNHLKRLEDGLKMQRQYADRCEAGEIARSERLIAASRIELSRLQAELAAIELEVV